MRTKYKVTIEEVMNLAINETLSRTIMTALVTLLVVIAMFMFGGEILNTFSLTLIFGFVVGCYSSIFIASPVVVWSRNFRRSR